MVFAAPGLVNLFRSFSGSEPLDLNLLVVAAVSCIVGSTMQISHKNLAQKKEHKPLIYWTEVIAIYVTGIVFGFAAYFVGEKYELWVSMTVGTIGSYLSLDFFSYLRNRLPKFLDTIFEAIIRSKINDKGNENNKKF